MNTSVVFVVYGEPASKANSRRVLIPKGKTHAIIAKSQKALDYVQDFALQCPQLAEPFTCDVAVTMKIYYASRRPDLDESVILDCMQSLVHIDKQTKTKTVLRRNIYVNDRQVREKHIYWGLDPANPRVEIKVEPLKVE